MHRAHRRDAVNSQKFYFRKNLFSPKPGHGCDPSLDTPLPPRASSPTTTTTTGTNGNNHSNGNNGNGHSRSSTSSSSSSTTPTSPCCSSHAPSRAPSPIPPNDTSTRSSLDSPHSQEEEEEFGPIEEEYDEFTINEIINGTSTRSYEFPGLLGVVRQYLSSLPSSTVSPLVRESLEKSLELVSKRADSSLITTASWMRNFVSNHPEYKKDSIVSKEINYDLVKAVDKIEKGELEVPELLPKGWRDSYDSSSKNGQDAFGKCCGDFINGLDDHVAALEKGAVVDVDCGIALGTVVEAK
jgi:glutamate--cysteine ligase catalytic subunit